MKDHEDSSSNDEGNAEGVVVENTRTPEFDRDEVIPKLLLDVVERLTKIAVMCESPSTADHSSVKNLVKNMYKFEKALRKLQKVTQQEHDGTDTIFKGALRAVDNYINPYDWAMTNVVGKYRTEGKKLDSALDTVDTLHKKLLERLQNTKAPGAAKEVASETTGEAVNEAA
ncbi:mediator complex subunit MED10, putative [Babesia ovata]|uniref:Mediator complex subunit MED10, putative n=1 Tax=Babesia ovata TaxID=189622 RepID=A0A2H6K9W2_9APIC|nr:mediator complex subunit MED10, putative [Babesia ovata]GBE59787.1 mediator complex subunit MED10, putative [Babesia ovata]